MIVVGFSDLIVVVILTMTIDDCVNDCYVDYDVDDDTILMPYTFPVVMPCC